MGLSLLEKVYLLASKTLDPGLKPAFPGPASQRGGCKVKNGQRRCFSPGNFRDGVVGCQQWGITCVLASLGSLKSY